MKGQLFKKLNEKLEINNLQVKTTNNLTEEDKKEIENKILFENFIEDTSENLINEK